MSGLVTASTGDREYACYRPIKAPHITNIPQPDSSTIPERICLGIAIVGALSLDVMTTIYLMQ